MKYEQPYTKAYQLEAFNKVARANGRGWRDAVRIFWEIGGQGPDLLQELRKELAYQQKLVIEACEQAALNRKLGLPLNTDYWQSRAASIMSRIGDYENQLKAFITIIKEQK